jgi:hypothetical protein
MPAARALNVLIFPVLVAVLVVASANSSATSAPAATSEPVAPATLVPGSDVPTAQPAEPPSDVPASPEPADSEAPSPSLESQPTAHEGSVTAGCTGTDENQEFFAEFARIVDWPVYCPVLPSGWFVGSGQWRQADGPRLEISYRGPAGAGLLLQQGAYCLGDGDCVPPGDDRGQTAFADQEGTLIATAEGWAIVVDPGDTPSWLLTITGVDEAAARRIASNLIEVGG